MAKVPCAPEHPPRAMTCGSCGYILSPNERQQLIPVLFSGINPGWMGNCPKCKKRIGLRDVSAAPPH